MQNNIPNNIPTEIITVLPIPQPTPRKTYVTPRLEDQGVWQFLTMGSCGTIIFPGDPPQLGVAKPSSDFRLQTTSAATHLLNLYAFPRATFKEHKPCPKTN